LGGKKFTALSRGGEDEAFVNGKKEKKGIN